MNNKAFTLIELLGVIIVLSLLAVLVTTSITKLLRDAKNNLSDTQMKLIESAAKQWGADYPDQLLDAGTCKYITLQDLQDYGYIGTDIIDPKSKTKITNVNVRIDITESKYGNLLNEYKVNPESIEGCTHVIIEQPPEVLEDPIQE